MAVYKSKRGESSVQFIEAYYIKHGIGNDLDPEQNTPGMINRYWKNILRTASTKRLEELYNRRCNNASKNQ